MSEPTTRTSLSFKSVSTLPAFSGPLGPVLSGDILRGAGPLRRHAMRPRISLTRSHGQVYKPQRSTPARQAGAVQCAASRSAALTKTHESASAGAPPLYVNYAAKPILPRPFP